MLCVRWRKTRGGEGGAFRKPAGLSLKGGVILQGSSSRTVVVLGVSVMYDDGMSTYPNHVVPLNVEGVVGRDVLVDE